MIMLRLTAITVAVYHTCVRDGRIFVQGHQRRIKQNDVSVFSDHPMVWCLNPRLVFVHWGDREQRVLILNTKILLLQDPKELWRLCMLRNACTSSISFHLKRLPDKQLNLDMNTYAVCYCNNSGIFVFPVLGRACPASISRRHSHFTNLLSYLFSVFCSFLPPNIPCRFQSAVPRLINDHRCAASEGLYPRPSQNKVHELRAWLRAIIE